jgi:hypothetical protein
MSDKSPRQSASRKSGRSIKEKRAIKKSKKAIAETDRMAVFLSGEPGPAGSEANAATTSRVERAERFAARSAVRSYP